MFLLSNIMFVVSLFTTFKSFLNLKYMDKQWLFINMPISIVYFKKVYCEIWLKCV